MSPGTPVEVRPATGDDVAGVERVAREAWYAAYSGFLDPETVEGALETYYDRALLEAAIDHEEIAFYVAADEAVVGFASAEQTWTDEVELHTLYVRPDRWGEGIGTALLERIEEWAREQGVDRIACAVLADNTVGVAFFEALGFERGAEAHGEVAGELYPEYEFELEL